MDAGMHRRGGGCVDGEMDGWMDGMCGWRDGWMDGWMGRYTYVEEFNVVGLRLAKTHMPSKDVYAVVGGVPLNQHVAQVATIVLRKQKIMDGRMDG